MNKIRVLLVTGSYPPMRCGVGDYTERLARAFIDQSGVELRVMTSLAQGPTADDPSWLHRVMPSWRIAALPYFFSVYRAFRPNIVHVQFPTQGYRVATGPTLIPLVSRWLMGASVVGTWHEYPPRGWTKAAVAMWGMAMAASAVIFVRPDYPDHVDGMLARMLGKTPLTFIPNASVLPVVALSSVERAYLRNEIGCSDRQLVSFFGFAHPNKSVEQLFEIADPQQHHLLLISELSPTDPYHERLRSLAKSDRWRGKVTVTGFVEAERVACLLAASDAAIFPFDNGGGSWNSSLHAATSQGVFSIVTSRERSGYIADQNIYYATPADINEMRVALDQYVGTRTPRNTAGSPDQWSAIASTHIDLYRSLVQR